MKTIPPIAWLRKVAVLVAAAMLAATPAWAGGKYASIVIDLETHQVLHDRDADEMRHPASLTKVMTLYLVFDALDSGKLKLSERMKVSKLASKQQPSKLGLKAGSTIKVEDAIRALVTKSANDVAVVIAERLGGTEAKFVTKMNAKAKELGMASTTFRNASGLPDSKQVTTARDMAKLAEAVYDDHRDRYNYFSLPSFKWNKRVYANHNELLRRVDGVDGIKTGFTNASGYNLMASAQRDGRRVIAVMLGGSTGKSRDAHVADLLEAAFLEIKGVPAGDDLRTRIAFGEKNLTAADQLAMAQLRKMSDADAALTSATDPTLVAAAEDEAGTTEEGEDAFEEVAEGDAADAADPADDPIGALIEASPGTKPVASTQVLVPASQAILITSEVAAGSPPTATSLDQLAQPVTAH